MILSDSVALPRLKPELCLFENTWPELLRNYGYCVHQVSIGGATSIDLLRQVDYHQSFNPDFVIVQAGIVDCSPRFMSKLELEVTRKIPLLGKMIIKSLNKKWVRKFRKLTYVKPARFNVSIKNIKAKFECPTFFLGIISPSKEFEFQLPGIVSNVKLYNTFLSQTGMYIPLDGIEDGGVMSDFHHINKEGHKIIFQKIIQALNKTIKNCLSVP